LKEELQNELKGFYSQIDKISTEIDAKLQTQQNMSKLGSLLSSHEYTANSPFCDFQDFGEVVFWDFE